MANSKPNDLQIVLDALNAKGINPYDAVATSSDHNELVAANSTPSFRSKLRNGVNHGYTLPKARRGATSTGL